jgi:hypothetical protein
MAVFSTPVLKKKAALSLFPAEKAVSTRAIVLTSCEETVKYPQ